MGMAADSARRQRLRGGTSMSRRPADLSSGPPFPGLTVAGWTVTAAAVVVGLTLPGAVGAPRALPEPPTVQAVLAADESPLSPSAPAQAAAAPAKPATAQPAAPSHALAALKIAMAQLGLPYDWGGNGPTNGDAGFDCSGLTHFAYATAGIALPRTAHTQFYAGPHVPAEQPLQPGDLVFYGTPSFVHHVGMYIGAGRMVNAPTFGEPVQVAYYRWLGDDYIGATRPDDSSVAGLFQLPFIPEAYGPLPSVPTPRIGGTFVAPRAPLPAPLPVLVAAAPVPEAQSAAAAIAEERSLGVAAPQVNVPAPTSRAVVAPSVAGTGVVPGAVTTPTTDPVAVPPVVPPVVGGVLPVAGAAPSTAPSTLPVLPATT